MVLTHVRLYRMSTISQFLSIALASVCDMICFTALQSGGEASIVAEVVEVEENSTHKMQTLRVPPTITVNKSAAYAVYEITYIRVCKQSSWYPINMLSWKVVTFMIWPSYCFLFGFISTGTSGPCFLL